MTVACSLEVDRTTEFKIALNGTSTKIKVFLDDFQDLFISAAVTSSSYRMPNKSEIISKKTFESNQSILKFSLLGEQAEAQLE